MPNRFTTDPRPLFVASGDFNNDTCLDLAVFNGERGFLSIFLKSKNAAFHEMRYVVGSSPKSIATGDFKNDKEMDLATDNPSDFVSVIVGNEDGTFKNETMFPINDESAYILTTDMNHDMKLELASVIGYHKNLSIILDKNNGTVRGAKTYATENNPQSIVTGDDPRVDITHDINKDTKLDLIFTNVGKKECECII